MALGRHPLLSKIATAAIVFLLVSLALRVAVDGGAPAIDGGQRAVYGKALPPGATTEQRIESLQARVRANPEDPDGYGRLGLAYLQRARESGDPSFYPKAEGVFRKALRLDPKDFTATSGLGSLALARHDFRGALELGERARRINPDIARNYGVIADAQIELGRYGDAERTLQHWVNIDPDLSSYARVSYFRELHGDLPGAVAAMRLAISAGGGSAESTASVQALLGDLELARGRPRAALRAYRQGLTLVPASPRRTPASPGCRPRAATCAAPSGGCEAWSRACR
jgi:tetratricopeptide (TPR) repeat protein